MNLNESFRYINFLNRIIEEGYERLSDRKELFTEIKFHKCSAANPDDQDYEESSDHSDYSPNNIVYLIETVMSEKNKVLFAIDDAKSRIKEKYGRSVDTLIEMNKTRQNFVGKLKNVLSIKNKPRISDERGYKFNNEGNQMAYYYKAETKYEDNFDRNAFKEILKEISLEKDETSNDIDYIMIETPVDYNCLFDVNSSFDDIIEELCNADIS